MWNPRTLNSSLLSALKFFVSAVVVLPRVLEVDIRYLERSTDRQFAVVTNPRLGRRVSANPSFGDVASGLTAKRSARLAMTRLSGGCPTGSRICKPRVERSRTRLRKPRNLAAVLAVRRGAARPGPTHRGRLDARRHHREGVPPADDAGNDFALVI